ncbi:hypothetical protein [Sporosarcina obsidiansis]|uniref:hypothetical protein n=1 Tax=Sporosarcina obsidiansis TaxID=2660748 RepID=UPI00129B25F1|nr:hypothetical protein [Sporosarcina obsidiansis]
MIKLFTYVPILCFIFVLSFLDTSLMKLLLLAGIVCLIIFAKHQRSKIQQEDIEFDDRVNANISKWSLRSMFLLNTLLILILFIDNQGILKLEFNMEMILLYLLLTLFIPFYIVPAIIKHY